MPYARIVEQALVKRAGELRKQSQELEDRSSIGLVERAIEETGR